MLFLLAAALLAGLGMAAWWSHRHHSKWEQTDEPTADIKDNIEHFWVEENSVKREEVIERDWMETRGDNEQKKTRDDYYFDDDPVAQSVLFTMYDHMGIPFSDSSDESLKKLTTPQSSALAAEKRHTSFLFDKRDAKSLDKETVFSIGIGGLEELIELDPDFSEAKESLFSETSLNIERSILSRQANDQLDQSINIFLLRITPYFLLKPAHKALEWLVYRFHIHQYNQESLLRLGLLYHDSNAFARLLQILEIPDNHLHWTWLLPVKKSQLTLTRRTLLNHCSADPGFLGFVCDMITHALEFLPEAEVSTKLQLMFSFVASVVIGTISDETNVSNAVVAKLIPHVARGLRSHLRPYNLCSQMIVCQLGTVTNLAQSTVDSLLKLLLLKLKPDTAEQTLKTAIVLCQRQSPKQIPTKVVKKLSQKADSIGFVKIITDFNENYEMDKLLEPLFRSLLHLIVGENSTFKQLFTSLCRGLKLSDTVAADLFKMILEEYTDLQDEASRKSFADELSELNRTLCRRYPVAFDGVRDEWLVRNSHSLGLWIKESNIPLEEIGMLVEQVENVQLEPVTKKAKVEDITVESEEKIEVDDPWTERAVTPPLDGDPLTVLKDAVKRKDWPLLLKALHFLTVNYFDDLSIKKQESLLSIILLNLCVDSLQTEVTKDIVAAVKDAVKHLTLPAPVVCKLLTGENIAQSPRKTRQRSVSVGNGNSESIDWKRVLFALESLHAHADRSGARALIVALFTVLERYSELDFIVECIIIVCKLFFYFGLLVHEDEDIEQKEYILRLTLSSISTLCDHKEAQPKLLRHDFKVDLIVKSLRTTHSQQTLQEALRLLNIATELFQDAVLSHIMSLFTFMGSGMVRKDDSFSFAMIHKTLDTVVGTLVKSTSGFLQLEEKLLELYRIFVSALNDIPEHRRFILFKRLLVASAVTQENQVQYPHLWILIGLIFERLVSDWNKLRSGNKSEDLSSEEELVFNLCGEISAESQMQCVLMLLRYLLHLDGVTGTHDGKHTGHRLSYPTVFDKNMHSSKQLRHFRYVILGWISHLLVSDNLIEKLAVSQETDLLEGIANLSEEILNSLLLCFKSANDQAALSAGDSQDRTYWKAVVQRCDLCMKRMKHLLPAAVSIRVIGGLLERGDLDVRKSAADLLSTKLLQQPTPFTRDHVPKLSQLANILCSWLKVEQTSHEETELAQTATYTLKLFVRVIGSYDPDAFVVVFDRCVLLVHSWRQQNPLLIGNALLCLAEFVTCLGTRTLAKLPIYLIDVLDIMRQDNLIISNNLLLVSALSVLHKIVEHLATFLNPYLTDILILVSKHGAVIESDNGNQSTQYHSHSVHRLKMVRKRLASIPCRLLIPAIGQTLEKLNDDANQVSSLFLLLSEHISISGSEEISVHLANLTDLFLDTLNLRSKFSQPEVNAVNKLEDPLLEAFSKLSLKLSESSFRPLIFKVTEWAQVGLKNNNGPDCVRLITLYRLSNKMSAELHGLITLFGAPFMQPVSELVNSCNYSKKDKKERLFHGKMSSSNANLLLCSVFDFIYNCSLYNTNNFIGKERFELLTQPLIEQLDNTKVSGYETRITEHLVPCLSQLCVAVGDDGCWQTLNYHLLMKTRSPKAKIRKGALLVAADIYTKLGESCAPLVPESVPFLSELFEDENEEVEIECQKVLKLLEKILGESVEQYF